MIARALLACSLALGSLPSLGCSDESEAASGAGGTASASVTTTSTGGGAAGAGGEGGSGGEREGGFVFEEIDVAGGLELVTDMVFLPDGTLLAASKSGELGHYNLEGDTGVRLGGFTVPAVYDDLDCGLLSLAVDPAFDDNGLIYAGKCDSETDSGIYRLTFDPADYAGVAATMVPVLTAGHTDAKQPWHNVGSMGFEPGGTLWAVFGEKTVSGQAQDLSTDLGALVRVVPNREPTGMGHTAAADNPFVGMEGASPNVYAYGLRSPWKASRTPDGRFWVADVGSDDFEELNLVTEPGQNLGWPMAEGPCQGQCDGLTDPLTAWTHDFEHPYVHDDPEAIPTGLRVGWVSDPYLPGQSDRYGGQLTDHVLFGDFCVGFVRAARAGAAGTLVEDRPIGHLARPAAWRQGPDGYLYASTLRFCATDASPPADWMVSRLFRLVLEPSR